MSRDDQHFRLRLPADLREKVEGAASASRRSMTAEILDRLEASFSDDGTAISTSEFDGLILPVIKTEMQYAGQKHANERIKLLLEALMSHALKSDSIPLTVIEFFYEKALQEADAIEKDRIGSLNYDTDVGHSYQAIPSDRPERKRK